VQELAFCRPSDWPAWKACPGRPALEEDLERPVDEAKVLASVIDQKALKARVKEYEVRKAKVTVRKSQKLDLSLVTGEKGAMVIAEAVLIADFEDHAELEVWDDGDEAQLSILALTAYLQNSLLHGFTQLTLHPTNGSEEWHKKPEELYGLGQEVTEAASLSLALRGDAAAVSHLVLGDYCETCLAKDRCPEQAKELA
jgi:hypothetical protein